jgi:hypothetical protein
MRGKKMHDLTHHHYRDGRPFPSSECVGLQVLTNGQPLKNYEDVFIRKGRHVLRCHLQYRPHARRRWPDHRSGCCV